MPILMTEKSGVTRLPSGPHRKKKPIMNQALIMYILKPNGEQKNKLLGLSVPMDQRQ
jgi:hypothetical protein